MPRPGIYTKTELRLEKQREKDEYEWWHGPAEELTPRDVMQLAVQTIADQHDRDADAYFRETGEHLPDFDAGEFFRRRNPSEMEIARWKNDIAVSRIIAQEHREALEKYGTLWDFADKAFPADILAEFPVVQCYTSPGYDYPAFPVRRGHVGDVYDPRWCIIIARKEGENNNLNRAELERWKFPSGTFIYNGNEVPWAMRQVGREYVPAWARKGG